MRSLTFPDIQCTDPFGTCLKSVSIKHVDYISRMLDISHTVAAEWVDFKRLVVNQDLDQLTYCERGKVKTIIAGDVKKSELRALYEIHMLKKGSKARKIYDALRVTDQYCPLCGVKKVATLDHYLPKSRYPLLSVNPENLVPACRECNTVKLDKIFTKKEEHTLYPYDEAPHFYEEDWITVNVSVVGGQFAFEFLATPPQHWSQVDKERVINHFKVFNLAETYKSSIIEHKTAYNISCKMLWELGKEEMVERWCRECLKREKNFSHLRAAYRGILANVHLCAQLT